MIGTLALLAGLAGSPAPAPPEPALEERVQVRRVRLPVYLEPQSPGGCDLVSASSIEIEEDGLALPALHLDTERLPAEHALLLDTSESMGDRLSEVREATLGYLDSLPPAEPALVATFDDDLILRVPMTTDRGRFRREAGALTVGWRTLLWDGLSETIAYLASRERRSVLIVLSDGCDYGSAGGSTAAIEAAAIVPALTIYTIGLDLPASCDDAGPDPRVSLRALAERTGGEFAEIEDPAEMRDVLRRIRERIERERFVSYSPPRFGAGPRDDPQKQTKRWRRVELKLRGHEECRLRGPAGSLRLEAALRIEESPATEIAYLAEGGAIAGTIEDIVRDRGLLSRRNVLGSVDVVEIANVERRRRAIGAPVPPLARVAWPGSLPEYALFGALTEWASRPEAHAAGEATAALWAEAPFLVHGTTLLERRLELGAALAGEPDYRRWATDRLFARRMADLEQLEREVATDDAARARLAAVREFFSGPEWRPEPAELAPYLSEWLADVPALRLHRAAETWLAQRLMIAAARSAGGVPPPGWIEREERSWREIGAMLGEQTTVRTYGLLVPGFDPQQDRIGFYRIVLARPTSLAEFRHPSPDAPRGLRLLGWAFAHAGAREALAQVPFEVAAIRYHPTALTAPRVLDLAGLPVPENEPPAPVIGVEVELVTRGGERERAVLRGIFAYREYGGVLPSEPLCLEVGPDSAVGPHATKLIGALVEARAGAPVPCVVAAGRVSDG